MWRKVLRTAASIGSGFLVAGPVLIPAVRGIDVGLKSGPARGIHAFVLDAGGFNLDTNAIDLPSVQNVVIRDAVLVGIGLGLRWAGRRI